MSDYMFMLDSHLNGEQSKALAAVRDAAEQANLNLFLTGGAMRDMMGGFPIRDLDFTVEGGSIKFAKAVAHKAGAEVVSVDELRKSVELVFPGHVPASIAMARQEKYAKPGAKPQVQPATIHEDLRGRDFTVNAIALSLGKASRGLLLDPANGLGDLTRRELRAIYNYALYDDPSRMLRMIRLRTRLGFAIDERTMLQYQNVREAKLEALIPGSAMEQELRQMASDPMAGEILKALEDEKLLTLFSPALGGQKLNLHGFQKWQKARQSLPRDVEVRVPQLRPVLVSAARKNDGQGTGPDRQSALHTTRRVGCRRQIGRQGQESGKGIGRRQIAAPVGSLCHSLRRSRAKFWYFCLCAQASAW